MEFLYVHIRISSFIDQWSFRLFPPLCYYRQCCDRPKNTNSPLWCFAILWVSIRNGHTGPRGGSTFSLRVDLQLQCHLTLPQHWLCFPHTLGSVCCLSSWQWPSLWARMLCLSEVLFYLWVMTYDVQNPPTELSNMYVFFGETVSFSKAWSFCFDLI